VAEEALRYFAALYGIERLAREQRLDNEGRRQLRQQRAKPIADSLRQWLTRQRSQVPDGSATAKAVEYSRGRWAALIRYLDDGDLPIDNNHLENRIRPVALGRSNWLFAGSLRAGQRAANIMSLIQSALCRARHKADHAEWRTMPNGVDAASERNGKDRLILTV